MRGFECEQIVIQYYQNKGYRLWQQRMKTPFAEIDLVFVTPQKHCLIVEVKSVTSTDFIPYRISKKQKQRQARALIFLAEKNNKLVEAHWAFVTKDDQVLVIEDIAGL